MSLTAMHDAIANKLVIAVRAGHTQYTPLASEIFNSVTPDRVNERMSILATDGDIPETGESDIYPEAKLEEAGYMTFKQATFKRKYTISKLLERFDNQGELMRYAMGLGRRAQIKMDKLCARVLTNGFSTEKVWDGKSLFHAEHQIGTTVGASQSNLVDGVLNDANFRKAKTLLRKLRAHDNTEDGMVGRVLLVPVGLGDTADIIINSRMSFENSNNGKNPHYNKRIRVVEWELLENDDQWFLLTDKQFHGLVDLVSMPFKVEKRLPIYTESGVHEIRVDFAKKSGAVDYIGVVGGTGV